MAKNKKILFIYPTPASFMIKDLNILKTSFNVKPLKIDVTHTRLEKLKDIFDVFKGVITSDVCVSWFVLDYAFYATRLSMLFKKKSVVVAGGFDVVSMPEIDYGAMQNPKRRRMTKFTLKHADKVLAVSESTKEDVLKWVKTAEVVTIYHGFDHSKLKRGNKNKEKLVLSVGTSAWHTLKVKGLETFVKSAKFLPDVQFILVGSHEDDSIDYLKTIASSNVEFVGYIPFEELLSYFEKAQVYIQVSAQESFGSALAEAMLCECVPVVTNRGAIPEVVGDTGFYVPYGDPEQTAQKIKEALKSDKGKVARERIKTLFPLEKRKEELVKTINELF